MLALSGRLADCGSGRVGGVVEQQEGTNATTGAGGRCLPRHTRVVPFLQCRHMYQSVSSALCRAMSCGMLLRSGVPAAHLGLPECSAYIHDLDVCFDHFNDATFSINTAP